MRKLEIYVDEESEEIKILNDEGELTIVDGLVIFAGKPETGLVAIEMYGSSASAAWVTAEAFRMAFADVSQKLSKMRNYFKQFSAHCAQLIDPNMFRNELEEKELDERLGSFGRGQNGSNRKDH